MRPCWGKKKRIPSCDIASLLPFRDHHQHRSKKVYFVIILRVKRIVYLFGLYYGFFNWKRNFATREWSFRFSRFVAFHCSIFNRFRRHEAVVDTVRIIHIVTRRLGYRFRVTSWRTIRYRSCCWLTTITVCTLIFHVFSLQGKKQHEKNKLKRWSKIFSLFCNF